ncbi:COX assembly mitochondrial protein 2 homolog [Diadema antillarum]|uniref:COX assembly mitochondrial protein 2 homolog n=1 Tax=Diadema antillarum TaxID=105358 RepID=UPI003A8AA86F
MHPDLSPHLHTEECNAIIRQLLNCHKEHPVKKFIGACDEYNTAMNKCFKKEYHIRLQANKEKTEARRKRMGLAD